MKNAFYYIMILMINGACSYNKWEEIKPKDPAAASCDTSMVISYSGDIVPIMNSSCGALDNNCHSSGSTVGGNVVLDVQIGVAYCATTSTTGSNGQLVSCITWDGNSSPMPKNGSKLSSCDIMKIQKW
ncbi:MAG: hypothetical protein ACJ76F_06985, partial [Bacteroidia bacterium]